MCKLLIISTLTFVVSVANAQQSDSLADVFPLAIGNKWLYQYYYDYSFYKPGPHSRVDTGRIEMKIVDTIPMHDTLD